MANHTNTERRILAQNAVHDHINRRRSGAGQIGWNNIHVVYTKATGDGSWIAVVLVANQNQKMYEVIWKMEAGLLQVDTFTREPFSRFYSEDLKDAEAERPAE